MVANDTVTVASLTIDNQGFGCVIISSVASLAVSDSHDRAIDNVTNGFGDGPNAGLIGLGYPAKYALLGAFVPRIVD